MVNVLAPTEVKLLLIEYLIASIAIRVPISETIPKTIMNMVITLLSILDLIDLKAIFIFSRSMFYRIMVTDPL
jgi:hypothetical protein